MAKNSAVRCITTMALAMLFPIVLRTEEQQGRNAKEKLDEAILQVRAGQTSEFESAFEQAQAIIASMPGYINHELQRCIEVADRYLLLVRWQRLEDHEVGFRQSEQYQNWRRLLHHFYDPFPTVQHFECVQPPVR